MRPAVPALLCLFLATGLGAGCGGCDDDGAGADSGANGDGHGYGSSTHGYASTANADIAPLPDTGTPYCDAVSLSDTQTTHANADIYSHLPPSSNH